MASRLKRTIFLFAGFLVLQTVSGAFAQGRMGMMMARQQMAMNAGMMGQFNPNLVPSLTPGLGTNWNWMSNIYDNRGYGYPGYGGGYSGYSGNSPSDYSGGDQTYAARGKTTSELVRYKWICALLPRWEAMSQPTVLCIRFWPPMTGGRTAYCWLRDNIGRRPRNDKSPWGPKPDVQIHFSDFGFWLSDRESVASRMARVARRVIKTVTINVAPAATTQYQSFCSPANASLPAYPTST